MSQSGGPDSAGAGACGVAAEATCGVTDGVVEIAFAIDEVAGAVGTTPGFSIRSKLMTKSVVPKAATSNSTKGAKRRILVRRAGEDGRAVAAVASAKR